MRSTTDINSMLSAPDKRIREASGLLSRLYRVALMELSITPYRWNFLLGCYLDKISKEREVTHAEITNERNNLRKGLNEPDMTFPMFVRGAEVLAPVSARFGVILEFDDGKVVKSDVPMLEELPEEFKHLGKLSYLFRNICLALGKDVNNLNPEIDAYLSNELVRQTTQGRKRGNDKGNLRRELPGDNITWEVLKKGLRILAPVKTTIHVDFVWTRRRKTTHRLEIRTPKMAVLPPAD